jgi:hypothetical protein
MRKTMSQEKSPGVTRSPTKLSGCLHGIRRVFEIQERNVLGSSFGATLASTKEGQGEAQSRDGQHACTSRSSRYGRSGWFLGV